MPSVTMRRNMPNELRFDGPLVDVQFMVSAQLEKQLIENKQPVPQPILVKALVDTGASHCVVQEDIPKKLGLNPIGTVGMNTPSSQNHQCPQYFMRMAIPSHQLIYEDVFTAMPLKGQPIESLIGRDLLSNGILIYIGYDGSFTLSLL